jgi:hypothetical protein
MFIFIELDPINEKRKSKLRQIFNQQNKTKQNKKRIPFILFRQRIVQILSQPIYFFNQTGQL